MVRAMHCTVLPAEDELEHVNKTPHSPRQSLNELEKILVGDHVSSPGYERT